MQGKQPVVSTTQNTTEAAEAAEWPALPSKVSNGISYHPNNTVNENGMARKQQDQGLRQKKMDGRASDKGHKLRGRREEPTCTLYLKNIYISNGEGDNDIVDTVRDYAMNKDMRLMSIKIMRYKTVRDIVGCRIIVPQSMEYSMCTPNFWPDGVTCRK